MREKDHAPTPGHAPSPLQVLLAQVPPLPPEEIARRKLGAQRLKERLSCVPFYAKAAEGNPECWDHFYASRVLS